MSIHAAEGPAQFLHAAMKDRIHTITERKGSKIPLQDILKGLLSDVSKLMSPVVKNSLFPFNYTVLSGCEGVRGTYD